MHLPPSVVLPALDPGNIAKITALPQTIMHSLSSLLMLGGLAVQTVFGVPAQGMRDVVAASSVDSFIATESPIALRNLLCNIGSSGACVAGAASGFVVASPDKVSPPCKCSSMPSRANQVEILTNSQTSIHGHVTRP
jgi:glucoamylase